MSAKFPSGGSRTFFLARSLLAFHRENGPFDEELVFSKMAGDHGISLLCFVEVEVILEV